MSTSNLIRLYDDQGGLSRWCVKPSEDLNVYHFIGEEFFQRYA